MILTAVKIDASVSIELPLSKSISNRLLLMQALSEHAFEIEALSQAEDTRVLQEALTNSKTKVNVGMAGTAFRFLTAFYAIQENDSKILEGAPRMHQRPIGVLVEALKQLGASVEYLAEEGYPPLEIQGKKLFGRNLEVSATISSQFISALIMISPYLEHGLQLKLQGKIISKPYIELTLALMQRLGVKVDFNQNVIKVESGNYESKEKVKVERDWSSAAFFYQLFAFSEREEMFLTDLSMKSKQGDKQVAKLFEFFGVRTQSLEGGIKLTKLPNDKEINSLDMLDCPDLVPAVAVCAAVLKQEVRISGIKSLRIKETNRIAALAKELEKIGAELQEVDQQSILIKGSKELPKSASFKTYQDHRMAMCLAPLAIFMKEVEIDDPHVVDKSFPQFWQELAKCGIKSS
ncbi:MAG: 3-phosphoshikimate 1-carboxyvinyltransferase [Vicingaceae bacterium]